MNERPELGTPLLSWTFGFGSTSQRSGQAASALFAMVVFAGAAWVGDRKITTEA